MLEMSGMGPQSLNSCWGSFANTEVLSKTCEHTIRILCVLRVKRSTLIESEEYPPELHSSKIRLRSNRKTESH